LVTWHPPSLHFLKKLTVLSTWPCTESVNHIYKIAEKTPEYLFELTIVYTLAKPNLIWQELTEVCDNDCSWVWMQKLRGYAMSFLVANGTSALPCRWKLVLCTIAKLYTPHSFLAVCQPICLEVLSHATLPALDSIFTASNYTISLSTNSMLVLDVNKLTWQPMPAFSIVWIIDGMRKEIMPSTASFLKSQTMGGVEKNINDNMHM